MKQSVILVAVAATAVASARASAAPLEATPFRATHRCGTIQRPAEVSLPDPTSIQHAAGGQRTIFLNRHGGTYQVGTHATDASTNAVSRIVSASGGSRTAVIPPLGTGFDWPTIAACVTEHFRRFNIRVVETEPTTGAYVEAVVGGTGNELGYGFGQLFGIAAADNFCGVTERGVAFSFSEAHRSVPQRDAELCATIAHEVGHLLGLEHEVLPTDLMSYVLVDDSGTKAFVDQDAQCGTDPSFPQGCTCGGSSTNSGSRLNGFLGLRSTETTPPTLDVVSPADALVVPPTFEVTSTATDNEGMADVTVRIDGVEVGVDAEPDGDRYLITLTGVAEGEHALEVVARDLAGNTAQQQLAIKVQKLAIGESCSVNEACQGNVCAISDSGSYCTQACDLNNDSCPDDFACAAVGAESVCVMSSGGCGCSSGDANPGAMALFGFGVGAVILRRRRQRVAA